MPRVVGFREKSGGICTLRTGRYNQYYKAIDSWACRSYICVTLASVIVSLKMWLRQEDGQDLVEYSLLLAFVVVTSAALFLYNSASISAVWGKTNNELSQGS